MASWLHWTESVGQGRTIKGVGQTLVSPSIFSGVPEEEIHFG